MTTRLLVLLVVVLTAITRPADAAWWARTPGTCPDSANAKLRPYIGSWAAQATFLHENGQSEAWPGKAVIEPDLGGCVLVEHLHTQRDSLPFEVLAVWGAQGDASGFERLMTHSQHGLFGLYAGPAVDGELHLDFTGQLPKTTARLRHVIRWQGTDQFTFQSERVARGDSTWRVTWRVVYRRRQHSP